MRKLGPKLEVPPATKRLWQELKQEMVSIAMGCKDVSVPPGSDGVVEARPPGRCFNDDSWWSSGQMHSLEYCARMNNHVDGPQRQCRSPSYLAKKLLAARLLWKDCTHRRRARSLTLQSLCASGK